MILAAVAAEPARGWGGPLAILAAFAAFRVLMPGLGKLRSKIGNPSPPPALPTAERVKAQATVGVTPDDTADTAPEVGWWGRIREVGGVRFRQAEQVWRTGSSELPPPDDEPADDDPEIDLALDDDEPEEPEEHRETAEEYIAHARKIRVPYSQIVKVLIDHYGIETKEAAKYRIRKVDKARA